MVAVQTIDKDNNIHSLGERLFSHALTNPKHDAVITPTFRLSYLELTQLVEAQVARLKDVGIIDESVVGINCANKVQHLVLCLAASYIGCTICTIPSYETEQVRNTIVRICGANIVIDESIAINPVDKYIKFESKLKSSKSARLLFSTSGTTGKPKLVVYHDKDLVSQAHRHVNSRRERFLCLASIEFNFAKRHRLYCVAMGATNVFIDDDQQNLIDHCQSLNVNVMHVSTFQAQELLAIPNINKLSNIRLKLGGSHADYSLRQKLSDGITQNLQAGYGTTETGAIAFTDPSDLDAGESVGQPLPGIEVRIVTPKKKALNKGERGEIAIRCKGIFREYLGNKELTNSQLENGWYYTGDIGYVDDQQRIHLCGRSDDMFVLNSINIYPQEIESQIRKFPGIADVAVLPKTSSLHGDIPVALIVFDKNIKPKLPDLKRYVRKKIGIRNPRQYIIVNEIPRNASGKIAHSKAMQLSKKSDDIREFIIQTLDERAIKNFKPLFVTALIKGEVDIKLNKFELDSLARMDLLVALEVNYDTIITPAELAKFRYFGHLVARVLSQAKDKEAKITSCKVSASNHIERLDYPQHHIVQLIRRAFSYCSTVTHFNIMLETLENRITPLEVEMLGMCNNSHQVLPNNAANKYHEALIFWLNNMVGMM